VGVDAVRQAEDIRPGLSGRFRDPPGSVSRARTQGQSRNPGDLPVSLASTRVARRENGPSPAANLPRGRRGGVNREPRARVPLAARERDGLGGVGASHSTVEGGEPASRGPGGGMGTPYHRTAGGNDVR